MRIRDIPGRMNDREALAASPEENIIKSVQAGKPRRKLWKEKSETLKKKEGRREDRRTKGWKGPVLSIIIQREKGEGGGVSNVPGSFPGGR